MEFVAEYLQTHGPDSAPAHYHAYLDRDRNFRASGYHYKPELSVTNQAKDFLHQRQQQDQKPLAGAAVHHAFSSLPFIWPDAKYIYLVRDPRDVARSCVQMGWAGTTWHAARYWLDAESEWKILRSRVPEQQTMTVSFEDLVNDSRTTLSAICQFLGVQFDTEMLEIERDTTYRRPNPDESRSWRDSAPQSDIRQVEARIGTQRILEAGYAVSDLPALRINFGSELMINMKDALKRALFRIDKYGVGLWMCGVISRRIPVPGWHDRVRRRIDDVDDSMLK